MKKFITGISYALMLSFLLVPLFSFTVSNDPSQNWEKLGQRKVNFKVDRDEISGRWDGIFRKLQVKVRGGSVSMQKMVVHFHNGQTQEIELKNNFTDDSESRVIDLPGNRRIIDKVVFWYEATSSSEGNKPTVELWGRHF